MNNYETRETVEKLQKYFGGRIIGSYYLVKKHYLDYELINDIDVFFKSVDQRITPIRQFLYDEGWKETIPPRYDKGYADVQGSFIFEKGENKPIHLCVSSDGLPVWTAGNIIASKFERSYKRDIIQLRNILDKNITKIEVDE